MSHSKVDITLLAPNLGDNSLGMAVQMAGLLTDEYSVEIIGNDFGWGINEMYRDTPGLRNIPFTGGMRYPEFLFERRKLIEAIHSKLVIAFKATSLTVPIAFAARRKRGCKVIVYLDEWDGAVPAMKTWKQRFHEGLREWSYPGAEMYLAHIESMIPEADGVISTTTFLQRKFGGTILPYGVDTEHFKPRLSPDQRELRKAELGLAGHKLIVFGGVVRPHKGVELILQALHKMQEPATCLPRRSDFCGHGAATPQAKKGDLQPATLLIVGPENEHVRELKAHPEWGRHLHCVGSQPKESMPKWLDLADLFVLPLKDNLLAQSQMPCKVFEAMAMAKPIIASRVSDLPLVLEGCGYLVLPEDAKALANQIHHVLSHPAESEKMGLLARSKCIREYSRDVVKEQLIGVIEQVLDGG